MTVQSAQQQAITALKLLYDEREAANIADWVMEHITGKKRIDRLLDKQALFSEEQTNQFQSVLSALATHKPVQYVLGEAWFAGMKFFVNESVLIPRPETEELVLWTTELIQNSKFKIKNLLEIGSGSGCIPISLKKQVPEVDISSIDISSRRTGKLPNKMPQHLMCQLIFYILIFYMKIIGTSFLFLISS